MSDRSELLPADGPGAPPRANGELVFAAPWESRIFGLTVALFEQGRFEWREFQQRLIAAVARHEETLAANDAPDAPDSEARFDYYACWLEAFRVLARSKGWLSDDALDEVEAALRARPAGHDHGHDHDH